MGGWNRRWQPKSHHDGSRRPPPPPPRAGYNNGNNQCPVPLWEREFCSYVGDIPWQRFCENKNFVCMYKDIEQWDDSAAFENFQNVKSRFWSHYHGQPSDIPLPDPDMYIDKVDQRCHIDPELVSDLDKVRLPFEADNESGFYNTAANKSAQNQTGNWDIYLEKPVAEVDKWEEGNSKSNLSWGVKHEPLNNWSKNSSGWGDALPNPGWGDALPDPGWGSSSNNNNYPSNNWNSPAHGALSNTYKDPSSTHNNYPSNNWNSPAHGASSNNAYKDPSSEYGRKRNIGGYSQQRNSKQRNHAEGSQRGGSSSRWQDNRGRNCDRLPFDNRHNGQRVVERGW